LVFIFLEGIVRDILGTEFVGLGDGDELEVLDLSLKVAARDLYIDDDLLAFGSY
jgi:hypothetical protein